MVDIDRLQKLEELKKLGINPYPYSFSLSHYSQDIIKNYGKLEGKAVSVAGRISAIRLHGGLCFLDLSDKEGKIQAWISEEDIGKKSFGLLKHIERGDFLGIEGKVTKTKRGEISVKTTRFELLAKSLRHLPSTWFGLKDTESRYRMRYVDLIMNPQIKKIFEIRTKIIDAFREVLNKKGYLEVDTPIIQAIYGGAAAKPFKTYVNDLKREAYLRISDELYLKRLVVGGIDKVYEFSKDFRNEAIDSTHNPEFTQIELYEAYADYNKIADLFEELIRKAAKKALGTTKVKYQEVQIDFAKPWKRISMYDALKEHAKIDAENTDKTQLIKLAKDHNLKLPKNSSEGIIISELFDKLVSPNLIQPTLLMNHPRQTTPLCKLHRKNPNLVERFEPYIAGMEVGNAYSELNDPLLQRKLLEEQAKMLKEGDEEAHPLDEDFITALEYGMPPTGGLGIGIDRLTMIFSDNPSIKEVIFFPMMRSQEKEEKTKN